MTVTNEYPKRLSKKLNKPCRKALETAGGLCLAREQYNVEVEHYLLALLDIPNSDLRRILQYYAVDRTILEQDVTRILNRLKTGNVRPPRLSSGLLRLMNQAWLIGSVDFGANTIRSGHLVLALLTDDDLRWVGREASAELQKIPVEDLQKNCAEIMTGSDEDIEQHQSDVTSASTASSRSVTGKTPALDQYTVDLTEQARQGKIDPAIGRDKEISQVIDILVRRSQNNPLLIGEAGVGKTAIVEGLALRIAQGDVPSPLKHVSLRALDLTLLQAGASLKGAFEERLKSVMNEIKASPTWILPFVDEAHTLIGAGGHAGFGDAANLLKPALARGELRMIAATTWTEYNKSIGKDPALVRRFQLVTVAEPDVQSAVDMMRGLARTLEAYHKVSILDEAIEAAVQLSHRYMPSQRLPGKSAGLLDIACARVALGHAAQPGVLQDCVRRAETIGREIVMLERETATGTDHRERLEALVKERQSEERRTAHLTKQWQQEQELVGKIMSIRQRLEASLVDRERTNREVAPTPLTEEDKKQLQADLATLNKELSDVQGDSPLLQPCVDVQLIAQVVSQLTTIPVGRLVKKEIDTIRGLTPLLEKRVIGQSESIERIGQKLKTARARLANPRRPLAVMMLLGPSGVGKTETALALAEVLFGSDQNMTVINMSEFKELHRVAVLMGSPPGYVGYEEGGQLTEPVRRQPYTVILLDEIEKAHEKVQDVFYRVFDEGTMKDGQGRDVDFKNTVIMMTSNVGSETIMKLCSDADRKPNLDELVEAVRPELIEYFKPAFLGRVTIIPYYPISPHIMHEIIELQLGRIRARIKDTYKASLTYDESLPKVIAARCTDVESGARTIDHIISGTVLPELSDQFLSKMAAGESIKSVHISVGSEGGFHYAVS